MTATLETSTDRWSMIDAILSPQRPQGSEQVLDDLVRGLFSQLETYATATCLVCGGRMEPRPSAVGVSGGRCRDCGASLG
jgi:hypothetical protein